MQGALGPPSVPRVTRRSQHLLQRCLCMHPCALWQCGRCGGAAVRNRLEPFLQTHKQACLPACKRCGHRRPPSAACLIPMCVTVTTACGTCAPRWLHTQELEARLAASEQAAEGRLQAQAQVTTAMPCHAMRCRACLRIV